MARSGLEEYREYVSARLSELSPFLQSYALGDFSETIGIPDEEDEFTELLVALVLMVDDIKELIRERESTITKLKRAEEEREQLILELQDTLAKVKTLSGLLPICANCKKVRVMEWRTENRRRPSPRGFRRRGPPGTTRCIRPLPAGLRAPGIPLRRSPKKPDRRSAQARRAGAGRRRRCR